MILEDNEKGRGITHGVDIVGYVKLEGFKLI
jgi:hypothetical protein